MAEDHVGARKDSLAELAPWMKLFTAFKIALDPKKLVLAGAGILVMWLGWWILSIVFFNARHKPVWPSDYATRYEGQENAEDLGWKAFKQDRNRWNLLHALAGPVPTNLKDKDVERYDESDLADTAQEYNEIVRQR